MMLMIVWESTTSVGCVMGKEQLMIVDVMILQMAIVTAMETS